MPNSQADLPARIREWMKGNESASTVCVNLINVLNLWDDLIDKDKDVSDDQINEAFRIALVDLPLNPFYDANKAVIVPLVLNAYVQWVCANRLEHGNDVNDLIYSYVLRDAFVSIVVNCAFIMGGPAWLAEVGPEIWRYCGRERFEEYAKEILT